MASIWRDVDREASPQTLGSSHTAARDGEGGNGVGVGESSPNCTPVPGGTLFGKAGCESELLKCGHGLSAHACCFPTVGCWGNITSFTFTDLNRTLLHGNSCLKSDLNVPFQI